MTTEQITRPGVVCRCGRLIAFADGRYGWLLNDVCPKCFTNIYRKDKDGPVYGRNLLGAVHELEQVPILHGGY